MVGDDNLNERLRPADLARRHGLSTQAIRNYEDEGVLPPALRLESGHRRYGARHVSALDAFVALTSAIGRGPAGCIMVRLGAGDTSSALELVDEAHAQLLTDRRTLRALAESIDGITSQVPPHVGTLTTVELARRLGITTTTLRAWERVGILSPERNARGHRRYSPADVRDAELAHLLRRGGSGLEETASVVTALLAWAMGSVSGARGIVRASSTMPFTRWCRRRTCSRPPGKPLVVWKSTSASNPARKNSVRGWVDVGCADGFQA